jgi:DNA segregation ATPase FtsK/SpoIIIE-like protein
MSSRARAKPSSQRAQFRVTSQIDSRNILGDKARSNCSHGDISTWRRRPVRASTPFVHDTEVENIVKLLRKQGDLNTSTKSRKPVESEFTDDEGRGRGDAAAQQLMTKPRHRVARAKSLDQLHQRHLQMATTAQPP